MSDALSRSYQNQKRQMPLKVGGASAHDRGARVEVGLMKGHRLSFKIVRSKSSINL
jgi:hypothetical protein